jgi:hypothetical protein
MLNTYWLQISLSTGASFQTQWTGPIQSREVYEQSNNVAALHELIDCVMKKKTLVLAERRKEGG